MKFGRFEISTVSFGFFRLDGGSMFGSVPKNLWQKKITPDEENRIRLATRSLLLKDSAHTFLVDTGMGEKWTEKERKIFAIENTPADQLGLNAVGLTDIILTHLHFDHAGGISEYQGAGHSGVRLKYPQARVYLQESNLKNAKSPNVKERASYLKDNIEPLAAADMKLVNGSVEIHTDIFVHQINGHTTGQQWIEIRDGKQSLAFPTDMIPTSHHLPLPFHMGYDICAETLLKEKQDFLNRAVKSDWIVVFEHDADVPAATVKIDERGHFAVRDIVQI